MSDLYELPKGWEWKKLDSLTEVHIGKTPKRSNKEYFLGDKVWLSIRDLKGDYVSDSKEKITDEAIKDSNIKIIPKGTLLMSFKLTLGRTAFADCDLYTNEAIASLPIKDESVLDKYFLKYSIAVIDLEKEVDNAVKGKTLNKQKIKNLDIPLPPLSEQKRIVSKLDKLFEKIDKSIALHQKNIDEADKFMGSVLNDIFEKDKVSNWKLYQFDKLSKFIDYRGKTPKKINSGIELITAKNVRFGYLSNEPKEYMSENSYDEWMVRGVPKKGDVLFTTEAPLGNVAILNTDEKRIFAQRIITFQPIDNKVYTSKFLFYYIMSPYFRDELFEKSTGTTVKGIKSSILKKFKIPLPPLQNQQKVVKYLDEISQKIEKLKSVQKEKMDSLKSLKTSILNKTFRG